MERADRDDSAENLLVEQATCLRLTTDESSESECTPEACEDVVAISVPSSFLCPISQDIMEDPVILIDAQEQADNSCAQSYERARIEEWMLYSRTCPLTRAVLHCPQLVPNRNLRQSIEDWRAQEGSTTSAASQTKSKLQGSDERQSNPGRAQYSLGAFSQVQRQSEVVKATGVARTLAAEFRAEVSDKAWKARDLVREVTAGTPGDQYEAAVALKDLAAESNPDEWKAVLIEAGALPALLELGRVGGPLCAEQASVALARLAVFGGSSVHEALASGGGAGLLVKGLNGSQVGNKEEFARAIVSLTQNEDLKEQLYEAGAIPPLVRLLRYNSESLPVVAALGSFFHSDLQPDDEVPPRVVPHFDAAGGFPVLARAFAAAELRCKLTSSYCNLVLKLAMIVETGPDLRTSGIVQRLVGLLKGRVAFEGESPSPCEIAVRCLKHLAVSEETRAVITEAGGVAALASLVAEGCWEAAPPLCLWADDAASLHEIFTAGCLPQLLHLEDSDETVLESKTALLAALAADEDAAAAMVRADGILVLAQVLAGGSSESRTSAARALQWLCSTPESRGAFRKAGGIPLLVKMLAVRLEQETVTAADTLSQVVFEDAKSQAAVLKAGGIAALLKLVASGTDSEQASAALAVGYCSLASNSTGNARIQEAVVAAAGIQTLVNVLRTDHADPAAAAARTLGYLCLKDLHAGHKHIQAAIGAAAAIPNMLLLFTNENTPDVKSSACNGLLGATAWNRPNCEAVQRAGAIPLFVAELKSGSPAESGDAAAVLGNLACELDDCVGDLVESGCVPRLVQLLSCEGSSWPREAAAEALKEIAKRGEHNELLCGAGAAEGLVGLLERNDNDEACRSAAECLQLVAATDASLRARVEEAGAVAALRAVKKTCSKATRPVVRKALRSLGCGGWFRRN